MRHLLIVSLALLITGCTSTTITSGDSITDSELEQFFVKHKVDGSVVAALKKRSAGVVAYLSTIHGYPNNLSVCEELIAPYNRDASMSVIPGEYFCEELRYLC